MHESLVSKLSGNSVLEQKLMTNFVNSVMTVCTWEETCSQNVDYVTSKVFWSPPPLSKVRNVFSPPLDGISYRSGLTLQIDLNIRSQFLSDWRHVSSSFYKLMYFLYVVIRNCARPTCAVEPVRQQQRKTSPLHIKVAIKKKCELNQRI